MPGDLKDAGLPAHVVDTIGTIAELRARHDERGSRGQRALRRAVTAITRPKALASVLASALSWALLNGVGQALRYHVPDPPPFFWTDTVLALSSLCVTLTILAIQRRDDQLSALREQLALELAVLGEQKNAKIIELIEELRRDLPSVRDRADRQATEMAMPADPREVMEAIENTQAAKPDVPDTEIDTPPG